MTEITEPGVAIVREPGAADSPRGEAEAPKERRIPFELIAIMTVAFVLCLIWALATPAFQAPDEQAHFAYVQILGERFELPGKPASPGFSSEHTHASSAVNADQVAGSPLTRP